MVWPELTTVRQPISRMAALATQMIIEQAAARQPWPQPHRRILHSEIILRASTGPPRSAREGH